jgi:PAS domain S-box-containing protein
LTFGIHSYRTRLQQQVVEEARRNSEARLSFALQTINTGAWEMDLKTQTAHRTLIHDQIFGYETPAPEWTYQKFLEHVLPEDRAEVERRFTEAMTAQADWNFECRIRRTDGAMRWIWAVGSHERNTDGQPVRMCGVVKDITERKLAEEKIREQAEMLNLAHDAITIRDLDQRITYWNHSAERIYGWTDAEAVGQFIHQLLKLDPNKIAEAHRLLLENSYWTGEFTARAKDGREVLIESSWTLVRDAAGLPKSILAFSVDITEQRKLEQQVTRNQRIESLGTLSSGIAHDLNNILTPIMVSIGMLKEQAHDPMLARLIASLDSSTQRGAQLVKQILTFGRGVKGERIPIGLRNVVREVELLIRETFPATIQFESGASASLWPVVGDPTQIHQVLLNLAINARDAMPNGGKLTLTLENVVIDEATAALNSEIRPGSYVRIQVADTGTGMTPKVVERIFDPFFTTKPAGQGTGLGLSTSLGIVKSHGGFINVYSEPGKGSTFKVYLPARAAGELTEAAPANADSLPRGRGEIVLLVDDEEAICTTVKKILERFGYRVLTAANGAEAVSIYAGRGAEIAVVITDMHMPIMDGPATIVALKSMNPAVKIIGSSGLAANGGVAKAASSGVRHFVPKPYSAEKMLRTLRDVLDNGNEESSDPSL